MKTKTAARRRAAKTKAASAEPTSVAIPTPSARLRRLRRTRRLRDLVAETRVTAQQLIMPHFVLPEKRANEPISSMPGIAQQGLETVVKTIGKDLELGLRAVLLFGHPEHGGKTPDGRAAAAANGAVQRTCERLKKEFGDELIVITDVCLCAYTDHGHCGVLDAHGRVLNDESLPPLVDMALSHARAGADVVAPSDMMDGRVLAIRTALDRSGFEDTGLLSYAVKFASAYYGPFREAADSRPAQGRPAQLSDGLAQRPRGGARGARRRRGRRGLAHGEARAALSRRDPRGARGEPAAAVGVQRLGRVLGGQSRGRERLAR